MVAVAGNPRNPTVVVRSRIELIEPGIVRQPYHAVEELRYALAAQYIRKCIAGTRRLALRAVRQAISELREQGIIVRGFGIVIASGRPLPPLAKILKSHPLLHTAEGELYRNALIHVAERCGLTVTRVREKELSGVATESLGQTPGQIQKKVAEMGKPIGAPWGQDQKQSALMAWLALSGKR